MSTQEQQRTNRTSTEWWSCRSVILCDAQLHCLLQSEKTYDLAEAYEDNLHVRFANADSDKELMDFIRGWGPLWIPNGQIPSNGVVALPLADCRAYQRQIQAVIGALTAFKWGQGEREALEALIKAEYGVHEFSSTGEPMLLTVLRSVGPISGNFFDWVKDAGISEVRAATNYLVRIVVGASFNLSLTFRRKGKQRLVEAGWQFFTLEEALRWMIWHDEFTKHPVICCQECRKVFRGETSRSRKYCSVECGHRATAREAMRRKRAERK
jgi:hypothetical protein